MTESGIRARIKARRVSFNFALSHFMPHVDGKIVYGYGRKSFEKFLEKHPEAWSLKFTGDRCRKMILVDAVKQFLNE